MGASMSRDDRMSISERLLAAAARSASERGRQLGSDATTDLHELVRNAERRLLDDHATSGGLEPAVRQAEEDVSRFIMLADEVASTLDGYPADRLGEKTYFPARMRFCPCYPFC